MLSNNEKAVYVTYPNLYIRCGRNDGICVTHVHFFEPNWNKDTNQVLFFPDINKSSNYFRDLDKYNSPFTEFSDYSIAQVDDEFTQGLSDSPFGDKSNMQAEKYAETGLYLGKTYPAFFPCSSVQ
ncbi:MAG: hypothetical protein K9G58_14730 [Bacteroidales bacterium]|nr:hypothetical protein [Bacteroidales bacterium]MCF8399426.1 hypothetical protein [Bacteroidales bacterium]